MELFIETYVHPASHAGAPSATGTAPIYGNRFRLKANFDDSNFGDAAKVVIKALKKYGMYYIIVISDLIIPRFRN